ncbi:hypothetical protein EDEG_03812 [Edhazardia aedis USNM 41457]|uniref:XPG N-terminal domain-containing protein n=1 Tax=Edhazardia aedis (strain USNM 41457) TaxID=1003232 RepID=J9DGC4_EDHAE|nr:hypothetical protein EDEG_03812 [Edhazardia aedis USNM 41457]|eukprot:EJW01645.1 hypothetical protein EDEG_03812 [Edhazardia aedis USNM 41457]
MGVKYLWRLFPKKQSTPVNQKLAIDTSIWLHYYRKNDIETFKYLTIKRILKLLFYKNKPIFVFDGKTPHLKNRAIRKRQQQCEDTRKLAQKYLKGMICKTCNTSYNVCKHATILSKDIIDEIDYSQIAEITNIKPKNWGKYYDDEIAVIEDDEFKNKSDKTKLQILLKLREKRKLPVRMREKLSAEDFSSAQIQSVKRRNQVNSLIIELENERMKRVQSDCDRLLKFSSDNKKRKKYPTRDKSINSNKGACDSGRKNILSDVNKNPIYETSETDSDKDSYLTLDDIFKENNEETTENTFTDCKNDDIICISTSNKHHITEKEDEINENVNVLEELESFSSKKICEFGSKFKTDQTMQKDTFFDETTVQTVSNDFFDDACIDDSESSSDLENSEKKLQIDLIDNSIVSGIEEDSSFKNCLNIKRKGSTQKELKLSEEISAIKNSNTWDGIPHSEEKNSKNVSKKIKNKIEDCDSKCSEIEIMSADISIPISDIKKSETYELESTKKSHYKFLNKNKIENNDIMNKNNLDLKDKNISPSANIFIENNNENNEYLINLEKIRHNKDNRINFYGETTLGNSKMHTDKCLDENKNEEIRIVQIAKKSNIQSSDAEFVKKGEISSKYNDIFIDTLNTENTHELNILKNTIIDILKIFNLPFVEAPLEADSQCAYFSLKNIVDAVITEDNDIFLFGGKKIYRNYFKNGKNIDLYDINEIKKIISRDEMIMISLILGSDYCDGIKGFGLKKSLDLIKYSRNLAKIAENETKNPNIPTDYFSFLEDEFIKKIEEQQISKNEYYKIKNFYKKPVVKEKNDFEWGKTDFKKIRDYIDGCGFLRSQKDEINHLLYKLDSEKSVKFNKL